MALDLRIEDRRYDFRLFGFHVTTSGLCISWYQSKGCDVLRLGTGKVTVGCGHTGDPSQAVYAPTDSIP